MQVVEEGSLVFVIPFDLEFDGDDHRGQIFVQLLQHDQLLQGQVEQPEEKQKEKCCSLCTRCDCASNP